MGFGFSITDLLAICAAPFSTWMVPLRVAAGKK
jgi:hypothetical protein